MKEKKYIVNKFLQFIRIIKPIYLSKTDIKWIKMCKLHYFEGGTNPESGKYSYKGNWTESLKPLFIEIYGWNPDEDNNYHDYLNCVFNKLLDIYLKIQLDQSRNNHQLRGLFSATFYRSISRDQELPIERAISNLCGQIQNNTVLYKGITRYYL